MKESPKSILYYGDNLDVLRRHVKDETVDLVYMDPPFNSNANYNVLFAEKDGTKAASQIRVGYGVKSLQAVEKLALSLINQWFSSHPSARIQ